jgi:hypothetical protein
MVDAHECGSRAGFDVPKRHVAATTFSKSKRSGDFKQKSCMAKSCLIEIEKSDSTGARVAQTKEAAKRGGRIIFDSRDAQSISHPR